VLACLAQAKLYRTNNIMLSMGSDFEFSNANTWYKNMDKLLHYLKIDGRLNAFYSTPTIYTQSKHDANITWTTKDDDWFPYADFDHAFWTGYFTSRPAFKAYVRSRSNLLQGCRHMELQTPTLTLSSFQLWEAMSVSQHHDGVSGTEKQHVTYDYTERLSSGSEECHGLFNQAYRKMYGTGGAALTFVDCPYINESICEPTTTLSKLPLAVSLYNTLGQARSEFIRLPIAAGANLTVYDRNGHVVTSDVFTSEDGSEDLFFVATMPPVGYNTYVLAPTAHENRRHQFQRERQSERRSKAEPTATQTIENKFYELTFTDGLLSQITNKASGLSTKITQSLFWYNASAGNTAEDFNQGQASGAYIFRPNCTENVMTPCKPFAVSNEAPTIDVVQTELVQVVHQIFSSWAEQRVILYADSDAIDIEYTVGPIPFEDGLGREIVSVFQSDITNDVFWTDANGREMQKRKQNFRPTWTLNVTDPFSSNFYPVDHCIFITDSAPIGGKQRQLTIITDRSHGGASLGEGELEVMVHRRTLYDDHRGVGEPMNETGVSGQGLVVTGTHRVTFGDKVDGPKMQKDNTQRLTFAPIIHFAEVPFGVDTFVKDFTLTRTALTSALPPNVHLLHMHDNYVFTRANEMILRLAHLYEAGEDPDMSKPVDVDLSSLLSTISIVSCTEMSLTANQKLSNVHRMTWRTESNGEARYTPTRTPFDVGSFIVTLNPMDIRTFSCEYNP
jgi:lysosomal alpha-mannosidase